MSQNGNLFFSFETIQDGDFDVTGYVFWYEGKWRLMEVRSFFAEEFGMTEPQIEVSHKGSKHKIKGERLCTRAIMKHRNYDSTPYGVSKAFLQKLKANQKKR